MYFDMILKTALMYIYRLKVKKIAQGDRDIIGILNATAIFNYITFPHLCSLLINNIKLCRTLSSPLNIDVLDLENEPEPAILISSINRATFLNYRRPLVKKSLHFVVCSDWTCIVCFKSVLVENCAAHILYDANI